MATYATMQNLDLIENLPTDKNKLTYNEIQIADTLFTPENKNLLAEFKEPFFVGILFILISLSSPILKYSSEKFFSKTYPSFVYTLFQLALFMLGYFIIKNSSLVFK